VNWTFKDCTSVYVTRHALFFFQNERFSTKI
jgi:hypothetical protein